MAAKLIQLAAHEAENPVEFCLREAFELLEPQLRPPFRLTIPTPIEYLNLNRAIIYGILCEEPHFAQTHIKHLHGKVTDGYSLFTSTLIKIVNELYPKLVQFVKFQLIWVTSEMVYVSAIGVDGLLVALFRQIIVGDFGEGNLWLCSELVSLCLAKWDTLLEEHPMVLTSALYTFLRVLADHYSRLSHNSKIESLKQMEIDFCCRLLRNQFHLCLKIGRDLIRLLQDLVHIPEFRAIWKDLVLNPSEFKTDGFSDISQLYQSRTSSRYFLLRISPQMETQLQFLLTHVKLGSQKRHQAWFATKFLCVPESEGLLIDIVRFICCAHHPSNEIIQSAVIPRWAVIGWLLQSCRKNYIAANMKLALFYDWLFFDERVDNIMNIEPAILLMVNSIPKYIEMTNTLLEFLFLLIDNYDGQRNDMITRGVSSALNILVRKGVVRSAEVLITCDALSPFLKERLGRLLSGMKVGVAKELKPACFPSQSQSLSLTNTCSPESHIPVQREMGVSKCTSKDRIGTNCSDASVQISADPISSCTSLNVIEIQVGGFENLVQQLGEASKSSNTMGLQVLEKILLTFTNFNSERPDSEFDFSPEVLSCKIASLYEQCGYKLFAPLESLSKIQDCDDEIQSATALIIRIFIFSRHERVQDMLIFWSRSGFPVGGRLLSYAVRLAYEARLGESSTARENDSGMPFLTFHVNQNSCFVSGEIKASPENLGSKIDKDLVTKLVDDAFTAYKDFLMHSWKILHKESDISFAKLLPPDLVSCFEWNRIKLKFLLQTIFHYLSDLSIGNIDIMKLLLNQLNNEDILNMQFEIGMKRYSIFGENPETISRLIKRSYEWGPLEQNKFWGLITSELTVSKIELERVILEFFCTGVLDPNVHSIAVGGLSGLCKSRGPTIELVGAIMLLPNNKFKDFAGAILAAWAASNASMLFDSLADFLGKLNNGDSIFSTSGGIMINESALFWLLSYLDARGMKGTDFLSKFSGNIPDSK